MPVSYTHLDVYKRQVPYRVRAEISAEADREYKSDNKYYRRHLLSSFGTKKA